MVFHPGRLNNGANFFGCDCRSLHTGLLIDLRSKRNIMPNQRLKIENLESLQELNTEEFSSIQGGLTAQISLEKEIIIDDSHGYPQFEPIPLPYVDPCFSPPPPCEIFVVNYGNKIIELKGCIVNL